MHETSEPDWGMTEDHCYFPEWADRPPATGRAHEVERNSYLAGGYAEEFGHRARPLPALALSMPVEEDGEWRVQIGCVHPGYPECARPLDRALPADARARSDERPRAQRAEAEQTRREPAAFRVVRVGQEEGARLRRRPWTPWRELQIRRSRLPLG